MKRPVNITNEQEWIRDCAEIAGVAKSFLDGITSVTAAARLLVELRHRVRAENDPDFLVFVGIESETDKFPLGEVRKLWGADALMRYDAERTASEAHYREIAERAARNLVRKYKIPTESKPENA